MSHLRISRYAIQVDIATVFPLGEYALVVTWEPPRPRTDRLKLLKTLPSCKLRMWAVNVLKSLVGNLSYDCHCFWITWKMIAAFPGLKNLCNLKRSWYSAVSSVYTEMTQIPHEKLILKISANLLKNLENSCKITEFCKFRLPWHADIDVENAVLKYKVMWMKMTRYLCVSKVNWYKCIGESISEW